MTAQIIDGKKVAEAIQQRVAKGVRDLGIPVKLVAVEVGHDHASRLYTRMQKRCAEAVGIDYELISLPENTDADALRKKIDALNAAPTVSAIILQMPLPSHWDTRAMQQCIAPEKDAECMNPANLGKLFYGDYQIAPCTPMAAVTLLQQYCPDLAGKETVVVGHSEIVGKPIAMMLLADRNASPTVTVCHVATQNLAAHTRRAEVLIVAAGVAQAKWQSYLRAKKAGTQAGIPDLTPLIKADMLRDGAIVIDVAINCIPFAINAVGEPICDENGQPRMKTVGDVDFDLALSTVAAITPVPGGVGQVTVAMLMQNTLACAKLSRA